jgi:hypothetical protein
VLANHLLDGIVILQKLVSAGPYLGLPNSKRAEKTEFFVTTKSKVPFILPFTILSRRYAAMPL